MDNANENRSAEIKITMIHVDQMDPNPWNPNEFTDEQRAELLAAVRQLGRLPKPVIVRRCGDRYEIIDGQHGWEAAVECGFGEIACEVVEVDDYVACSETFRRNQHGKHCRVRQGRMFRKMLEMREVSQRKLAADVGMSESTLRNDLAYSEAADLRNDYYRASGRCPQWVWEIQPDDSRRRIALGGRLIITDPQQFDAAWGDQEVAQFSLDCVHTYLALPIELRDRWANAGANLKDLAPHLTDVGVCGLDEAFEAVVKMGLADLVSDKMADFRPTLNFALGLAKWGCSHARLPRLKNYIRAVGEHELSVKTLDLLPCTLHGQQLKVLISVEEWLSILSNAKLHTDRRYDVEELVKIGVRSCLERNGVSPETVQGPVVAAMLDLLQKAPGVIRDAQRLSLEEKIVLYQALGGFLKKRPRKSHWRRPALPWLSSTSGGRPDRAAEHHRWDSGWTKSSSTF